MRKGVVSVVIPNYNYAQYLREAIDSALAQTYAKIEVIVVDDGSTDGSKGILESYGDKIAAIFQQNQGVSAARNNGISLAEGEFFAFLDADDVWLPEKIEKQIAEFQNNEDLGLVHVGVVEIDENGEPGKQRLDGGSGSAVSRNLLLFSGEGILGGGSGAVITRKAFDMVGGFDERLSTSADWDFFYQISSRFEVSFVPEILLKYRVHNSNMHANISVMEHDMLLAYEKAFDEEKNWPFMAECYGVLYKTLSGSYFHNGDYWGFVRTAFESLLSNPRNLWYFLKFPLRKLGGR